MFLSLIFTANNLIGHELLIINYTFFRQIFVFLLSCVRFNNRPRHLLPWMSINPTKGLGMHQAPEDGQQHLSANTATTNPVIINLVIRSVKHSVHLVKNNCFIRVYPHYIIIYVHVPTLRSHTTSVFFYKTKE